jgi:RNA polymerase-binding transcription factor DksA
MAVEHEALRRAHLQEEAARLHAQLDELGVDNADALTFDDGFADSSQVTAERAEIEALVNRLTESLREIEDALAKFEAGTYGTCESCGGAIGESRLEAMPSAQLCISCASKSH